MNFLPRPPLLRLLGAGVVGLVLLQFIRPRLDNPPVTADFQAPPEVKQVFQTSCYNCHSNETKLAWFDEIVPGYWLVAHDVTRARAHLNFSAFGRLPAPRQKALLYEAVNQVRLGAMPLPAYRLLHPESKVTAGEIATLENDLHPAGSPPPAATSPADVAAADAQYRKWLGRASRAPGEVKPAPNGLAFFPDYRDWKPVSTTDRFDNDTMRVIVGNDVAVRAIAQGRIHPWPDGAAFAKIAWKQQHAADGTVRAGEFFQVEFMVKDAHRYAATEGWGWGRWRGADLAPYGKDAGFSNECTACHAPMRGNDFVFTMPIRPPNGLSPDLVNAAAVLSGDLPGQPLSWRVISSSADHAAGTMSTLYGNDLAVAHTRTSPGTAYPAGAVLALVTWKQRDDPHWFGARIPSAVRAAEFVSAQPVAGGRISYLYQAYRGSPLRLDSSGAAASPARVAAILGERPSVMP